MLLITEQIDQKLNVIQEAKEDGKKSHFIEGVFLMGDRPNKNGRIYSSKILEKEVARYTNQLINENRAYGELGHPSGPSINMDRVSHLIKSLHKEGSNYIGKAKIASTPMGDIVKGLLEDGANLGVSSRGMGSVIQRNGINEVQDDFKLATAADIVADPSAHNAFVRGIMENVTWLYDAASDSWKASELLDEQKKKIHTMSLKKINEHRLAMFEEFLNTLVKK